MTGSGREICIHGHFYQPPRENPWLEAIEVQDSAYPYHDWNERITSECYGPNAASRILDGDGRIARLVNNYARISFNFGPTLLAWLEDKQPEVYAAVLEADRESARRFGGHGSALAQAYNHMIMPLANERDRRTQVRWGVIDFEHRFGRRPEGMWLPETAVDVATLEVLAEAGITFTVLAPHQAARVRPLAGGDWHDVSGARIDPHEPYRCPLPSGRSIDIFFYDGPVSRAVAFEGLLSAGERFAGRLVGAFDESRRGPQLVHIATDGETYGHHHRYGDMALAYALEHLEAAGLATLTNYGHYLERHPPRCEVEIVETTSWSCVHGVERWRSDCGCSSGMNPGWNQAWRGPLREALDWLRDALAPAYEREAGKLLTDPWAAREEYARVILDRSSGNVERFLAEQARRTLDAAATTRALELLELQRQAMLMYTSCGWFFDDLSGIETVQVIQYAGRALQLAEELFGRPLEGEFLERLAPARSNLPEHGDGRAIYVKFVKPSQVDLAKVAAHYAMSTLFEEDGDPRRVYSYSASREEHRGLEAGLAKLAVGRVRVTSEITRDSAAMNFGVVHFGDHNLHGGVRPYDGDDLYQTMLEVVADVFAKAEFAEAIRWLDGTFGSQRYSLHSLFRDDQRRILGLILEGTLREAEGAYRQTYEHHAPLMRFLADLGVPLPKELRAAAEIVVNTDLRRAFAADVPDAGHVRALFADTASWRLELDVVGLAFELRRALERLVRRLGEEPDRRDLLERLVAAVDLADDLPFEVDLWRTQNRFYEVVEQAFPAQERRAEAGDAAAAGWVRACRQLAGRLAVRVG